MKYDRNKLLTFKKFSSSGKESNTPPLKGYQSKTDGVKFPSSGGVAVED
jgi:hypothetical protein